VVVVTSINRLVAARPHAVANDEAPDPDIIMRRLRPRKGPWPQRRATDRIETKWQRIGLLLRAGYKPTSRARPICATPTRSDGPSATVLAEWLQKESW